MSGPAGVSKRSRTKIESSLLRDITALNNQVRAILESTGIGSVYFYNLEIEYKDETGRLISNKFGRGKRADKPVEVRLKGRKNENL